ncbi:MAG: hypothetical protein NXI30_17770 [bacterium]|nr:hypothetical protein [bacterium]
MTSRTTKSVEAADFALFRERLSSFPVGPVDHVDRPDFRVRSSDRLIGIELSRIFVQGEQSTLLPQAAENISRQICYEACVAGEHLGLPPLQVAVSFRNLVPLNRARRQILAKEIAQSVSCGLPDSGERRTLRRAQPGGEALPEFVNSIFISNQPGRVRNHWHEPSSGWVQVRAIGLLQEAISSKSPKINGYLESVDECWLVLVADDLRASGMIQPDPATLSHEYESPFARTHFLNTMKTEPDLLRTKARA